MRIFTYEYFGIGSVNGAFVEPSISETNLRWKPIVVASHITLSGDDPHVVQAKPLT